MVSRKGRRYQQNKTHPFAYKVISQVGSENVHRQRGTHFFAVNLSDCGSVIVSEGMQTQDELQV
jgi:hypothetical protein